MFSYSYIYIKRIFYIYIYDDACINFTNFKIYPDQFFTLVNLLHFSHTHTEYEVLQKKVIQIFTTIYFSYFLFQFAQHID